MNIKNKRNIQECNEPIQLEIFVIFNTLLQILYMTKSKILTHQVDSIRHQTLCARCSRLTVRRSHSLRGTYLKWSCKATLKSNESPRSAKPRPIKAWRPSIKTIVKTKAHSGNFCTFLIKHTYFCSKIYLKKKKQRTTVT